MSLSETDQERINASLEIGSQNFTQEDLKKVMGESEIAHKKSFNLGEQFENFKVMWTLLQDYWNGDYTKIPWTLISSIGFAVAYLISPIDVIPDFIPIAGFSDDTFVFALVFSAFNSEIEAYKKWKKTQIMGK